MRFRPAASKNEEAGNAREQQKAAHARGARVDGYLAIMHGRY
ncbi:hypothetical protein BH23ACT10_BH23ACT10_00650 [soil metagenome]